MKLTAQQVAGNTWCIVQPRAMVPYYQLNKREIILLDSGCMLHGELEEWLEGQGLLTSEWETGGSKPRKYYRVTPEGREVCARLKAAWQATVESVQRAMETEWEGKTDEQGE